MVRHTAKRIAGIKLRQKGKSYGEILKQLNISSKGTLAYWFRNLKLSPEAEGRLAYKKELARQRGLFAFNERRTKTIATENKKIFKGGVAAIRNMSRNDLLLIGTALYWGEGSTRDNKRFPIVSFSNTDPHMVKVFMRYLREALTIPDKDICVSAHIHPNIAAETATEFWAQITGLPLERFAIYRAISSASKLKRPKNFLPYGTVQIRVNHRQPFYKIKGYIQGIINGLGGR